MSNLKFQFTFFPFLYLPMRTIFWYICPHNILEKKKKTEGSCFRPSKTSLLKTNFSYEEPGAWFYTWTFSLEPASHVNNHIINSRCDSPSKDLLSPPLKASAKVYNVICSVARQEQFTKSSKRIISFHSHREKKTDVDLRLANFL